MKCLLVIIPMVALTVGCTTTDEIIIDEKGVDMRHYEDDLAECKGYSENVKTTEKAAKGATSGAVVGGLLGAVTGDSESVQQGAGVGAVTGGARGLNEGEKDTVRVVKNCLRGRGYKVLN
jgi:outer membrane lipoprotein SlyB